MGFRLPLVRVGTHHIKVVILVPLRLLAGDLCPWLELDSLNDFKATLVHVIGNDALDVVTARVDIGNSDTSGR